ncbi:MAG: putative sulfate exporter family transporter [Acidobacteria bacterium]|uniref:Putative sulfate exporter family transporter n=1 Tax=Candidatus Polarisedimenticola svalbardensis TaxID=2886004 RepID=A0A8J6Y8A5_9BACT|nr:putative sulfate exporter family transporter [Candidatus Polarisedimenticola svalbardensis]
MTFKARLPGVALASGLGILSVFLSRSGLIPFAGAITIAIVLGILVGNFAPVSRIRPEGISWCETVLLSWAVALMGLNLDFGVLADMRGGGGAAVITVVIVVAATLGIALVVGRSVGLPRSLSLLLGVGSAICGSSAIAAVAPLVTRDRSEIGLSISVVNLLGVIGIFLLPAIVVLQGLGESSGGLLIGGSLQAVGHVVAAGFSVSDGVGELATVVKMFRILLLGPVVIGVGLAMRSRGSASWRLVPGYIVAFIVLAVVGNLGILPEGWTGAVKTVSKVMLAVAMAGVGLRIQVAGLIRQGPRALLAGGAIFVVQIVLLSLFIRFQGG